MKDEFLHKYALILVQTEQQHELVMTSAEKIASGTKQTHISKNSDFDKEIEPNVKEFDLSIVSTPTNSNCWRKVEKNKV